MMPPAACVAFDITIKRSQSAHEYTIHISTPSTDQLAFKVHLITSTLETMSDLLSMDITLLSTREVGQQLFDTFFPDQARIKLFECFERAKEHHIYLRILLQLSDAPELSSLPWEYLYDSDFGNFLLMSRWVHVSLVRCLNLPSSTLPSGLPLPFRILILLSNPQELPPLNIKYEQTKIINSLDELSKLRQTEIDILEQPTLSSLQQKLTQEEYHIVHFIGHGLFSDGVGYILLEGEDKQPNLVSGKELSQILQIQKTLQLVFLNCSEGAKISHTNAFGGIAQSLLQSEVPAVIAMQSTISDQSSAAIAYEFYASLADSFSLDLALTNARYTAAAQSESGIDWGIPVLYARTVEGKFLEPVIPPNNTELEIRKLMRCRDLNSISTVHETLLIQNAEEQVKPFVRIFQDISSILFKSIKEQSKYNQRLILRDIGNKLDELKVSLLANNDRYSIRFYSLAQQWLQVTDVQLSELSRATTSRQELDSPYIIGTPLTFRQEIFVGREALSNRIEQLLLMQRVPLLLYGQRRMGKTSLLNNLSRLLPTNIIPLVVDLQGPASSTDYVGFLYNLARSMRESAQIYRNLQFPRLSRRALSKDPFTTFDEWLDKVEQRFNNNKALLMFDEFEKLDYAIRHKRFDAEEVLGLLRHLIQFRPRFNVLLAGSHTLDEYQDWANYLISVQVLHISYLNEAEARQLIERPISGFALRYESDASKYVVDVTRCHPFLIQLLCAEIIAYKNEQEPSLRLLATFSDVNTATPMALKSGSMFFADIERNQVNDAGRVILQYIASQGKDKLTERTALTQVCSENLEKILSQLMQQELIEQVGDSYRFQVEMIRLWFARQTY